MPFDSLSRRQLLAGLTGVTGVSAASLGGGLALSTRRSQSFTETRPIQTGEVDGLVVDWRETYNGATLTNATDGLTSTGSGGPAISLGNVLPGDSGSFSFRLRFDDDADDADGAGDRPSIRPELTFELLGEPRSPGLQEFIYGTVWYDTGLFGVGAFGSDNGERDFGEPLVHDGAEGTFGHLADVLGTGVPLDAAPTLPGTSCLEDDDSVTITFAWSFPTDQENINAVQGDNVAFDLRFDAVPC